jgi:hypothetical protein
MTVTSDTSPRSILPPFFSQLLNGQAARLTLGFAR